MANNKNLESFVHQHERNNHEVHDVAAMDSREQREAPREIAKRQRAERHADEQAQTAVVERIEDEIFVDEIALELVTPGDHHKADHVHDEGDKSEWRYHEHVEPVGQGCRAQALIEKLADVRLQQAVK